MIGALCVREEWGRLSAQKQSQEFDFAVTIVIVVYRQGFLVYKTPLQHDIKHHHLASSRILQMATDPKTKSPGRPSPLCATSPTWPTGELSLLWRRQRYFQQSSFDQKVYFSFFTLDKLRSFLHFSH